MQVLLALVLTLTAGSSFASEFTWKVGITNVNTKEVKNYAPPTNEFALALPGSKWKCSLTESLLATKPERTSELRTLSCKLGKAVALINTLCSRSADGIKIPGQDNMFIGDGHDHLYVVAVSCE